MPQVPTKGIRVTLLHIVIQDIIDRIVNWLIVQEQVSIRTPDQEVIPPHIIVISLPRYHGSIPLGIFCSISINYYERELSPPLYFKGVHVHLTLGTHPFFLHAESITGGFAVILPISLFKTISGRPLKRLDVHLPPTLTTEYFCLYEYVVAKPLAFKLSS